MYLYLFRLTVGPAIGAIRELLSKIKSIVAKHGKFEFALCLGDFFGPLKEDTTDGENEVESLLDGKIEGRNYEVEIYGKLRCWTHSTHSVLYHARRSTTAG